MNMTLIVKNIPKLAFGSAVIVAVVIAVLSLEPSGGRPSLNLNDKLHHFIAYAVFSFLAVLGRHQRGILAVVLFVSAYGVLMEGLQGILPFNRSASWLDIIANLIGVAGGTLAALVVARVLMAYTSVTSRD